MDYSRDDRMTNKRNGRRRMSAVFLLFFVIGLSNLSSCLVTGLSDQRSDPNGWTQTSESGAGSSDTGSMSTTGEEFSRVTDRPADVNGAGTSETETIKLRLPSVWEGGITTLENSETADTFADRANFKHTTKSTFTQAAEVTGGRLGKEITTTKKAKAVDETINTALTTTDENILTIHAKRANEVTVTEPSALLGEIKTTNIFDTADSKPTVENTKTANYITSTETVNFSEHVTSTSTKTEYTSTAADKSSATENLENSVKSTSKANVKFPDEATTAKAEDDATAEGAAKTTDEVTTVAYTQAGASVDNEAKTGPFYDRYELTTQTVNSCFQQEGKRLKVNALHVELWYTFTIATSAMFDQGARYRCVIDLSAPKGMKFNIRSTRASTCQVMEIDVTEYILHSSNGFDYVQGNGFGYDLCYPSSYTSTQNEIEVTLKLEIREHPEVPFSFFVTFTADGQPHQAPLDVISPPPSEDHFAITADVLHRCFEDSEPLQLNASVVDMLYTLTSEIVARFRDKDYTQRCDIELLAPEGMVFLFQTPGLADDSALNVDIVIKSTAYFLETEQIMLCCFPRDAYFNGISTDRGNRLELSVWLNVGVHYTSAPSSNRLRITAEHMSTAFQLELKYTTPSRSGWIQTQGWDEGRYYPPGVDSCVTVESAGYQAVMVSFVAFDLEPALSAVCNDFVEISNGIDCSGQVYVRACGTVPPATRLFHTNVLSIRFKSDLFSRYTGFRLLFSFHNQTALPQWLSNGKWNCSVDFWPDFQQHLICRIETECEGGEDRLDCSLLGTVCGRRVHSWKDKCYIRRTVDRPMSWTEAEQACLREGGYLSSLNDEKEWKRIVKWSSFQVFDMLFAGLQMAAPSLPEMYLDTWQWLDGTIAYYLKLYADHESAEPPYCAAFSSSGQRDWLSVINCERYYGSAVFFCEIDPPRDEVGSVGMTWSNPLFVQTSESRVEGISLRTPSSEWNNKTTLKVCPAGHTTHDFLACDAGSECWPSCHVNFACWNGTSPSTTCSGLRTSLPPSYLCRSGVERVAYSLVCDHRADCTDDSDEDFCVFPPCTADLHFSCGDKQCIMKHERCDGVRQCINGADELKCRMPFTGLFAATTGSQVIISFTGTGSFTANTVSPSDYPMNVSSEFWCPETHFQCPGDGYCLPVYVRCNGVYDCPGKEDEADCDRYTCPGFYRCRNSRVCVHPGHVCDRIFHCPHHDDELMCDVVCPESCVCFGLAFYCDGTFAASNYTELRFLDARKTGMTVSDLAENIMLIHLVLAECGLRHTDVLPFSNLHHLDLSSNLLTSITGDQMIPLYRLRFLSLANNPLVTLFDPVDPRLTFPFLTTVNLSGVPLQTLPPVLYALFPQVETLNLSGAGVNVVGGRGFQPLKRLHVVDVRGCPMTEFPPSVFQGLDRLQAVYADNFKLCCPATLPPDFSTAGCEAPANIISSCDSLLGEGAFRVFLVVFAILALLGNLVSFVYRVCTHKSSKAMGFDVFVANLCVSDFLMGGYLAIIGVADRLYHGNYLWEDRSWKKSVACQVAGFLSLLSSEVSAFIICLITLERFLVLRFPFSTVHFTARSAHVASAASWLVGMCLATVPLLPVTSHWDFYSHSDICIPLPVGDIDFPGHGYSLGVMIVLNFLLFVLIAVGQVLIYWSVRAHTASRVRSSRKSQDTTIARRLFSVVMSDFLCWFPIGLLGLLAATGVPISREVSVAMAIFVLPFNSALNPFLYTISILLEKRRRAQEQRMQQAFLSEMNAKLAKDASQISALSLSESEVRELLATLAEDRRLSAEEAAALLVKIMTTCTGEERARALDHIFSSGTLPTRHGLVAEKIRGNSKDEQTKM